MSVHLARQPPSRYRPARIEEPSSIFTALNDAKRVVDFQKAALPLSALKEWVYYLSRAREAGGVRCPVVDAMASVSTYRELVAALRADIMERFGASEEMVKITDRFVESSAEDSAIDFVKVDLPEAGCQLAIIPSNQAFFDTHIQHNDGELWLLDWSDLLGVPPTEVGHPDRHLIITGFSGVAK